MAKSPPDADARRALRVHGRIARDMGIDIVTGRYKPGDLLTGEVAASDELHVSRTAYREAVRILAAKGLVESRPKIGTRVSRMADWHLLDPDVLEWMFQQEPDPALLAALFELRRIVEPEAAALAARRRSDAQLDTMRDALRRMEELSLESEAGRRADQAFHAAMLDAAGNAFLASLTSGVPTKPVAMRFPASTTSSASRSPASARLRASGIRSNLSASAYAVCASLDIRPSSPRYAAANAAATSSASRS